MTRIPHPKRRRKRKPFSFPTCRLREIERTIPTRDFDQIKAVLPEVAVTYRVIIAHRWCGGVGEDEVQDRMQQWCTRMRIKFSNEEIAEAINQAERRKHLAPAERLAEILGLEYCERQALAINTIGAIDMTKRQRTIERKKRKRERDRIRGRHQTAQAQHTKPLRMAGRSSSRTHQAVGARRNQPPHLVSPPWHKSVRSKSS